MDAQQFLGHEALEVRPAVGLDRDHFVGAEPVQRVRVRPLQRAELEHAHPGDRAQHLIAPDQPRVVEQLVGAGPGAVERRREAGCPLAVEDVQRGLRAGCVRAVIGEHVRARPRPCESVQSRIDRRQHALKLLQLLAGEHAGWDVDQSGPAQRAAHSGPDRPHAASRGRSGPPRPSGVSASSSGDSPLTVLHRAASTLAGRPSAARVCLRRCPQ
jgi:hypothetical protein